MSWTAFSGAQHLIPHLSCSQGMSEGYRIHLSQPTLKPNISRLLSKSDVTEQAYCMNGSYIMQKKPKQPDQAAVGPWLRPYRRSARAQQVSAGAVMAWPSRNNQSDLFRDARSLPALPSQLLYVLHSVCICCGQRELLTPPPAWHRWYRWEHAFSWQCAIMPSSSSCNNYQDKTPGKDTVLAENGVPCWHTPLSSPKGGHRSHGLWCLSQSFLEPTEVKSIQWDQDIRQSSNRIYLSKKIPRLYYYSFFYKDSPVVSYVERMYTVPVRKQDILLQTAHHNAKEQTPRGNGVMLSSS